MNFQILFQLLMTVLGFSTQMDALKPGESADSVNAGLPPAVVTWRDGRKFHVGITVRRVS